jgi:hypothetical protein
VPGRSENGDLPNLHVDEYHKVLYCSVPKAASTTMKALMMNSNPKYDEECRNKWKNDSMHNRDKLAAAGIHMLHTYSKRQQEEMLRTFTKIIIVRHPLSRLQSAYRMFTKRREYLYKLQRFYKRFHGADSTSGIPSFSEFVIMSMEDREDRNNIHWVPYALTCQPCTVHYDLILKQETLSTDIQLWKQLYHAEMDQVKTLNSFTEQDGKQTLDVSPFYNLSSLQRKRILKRYRYDMTLFGYSMAAVDDCSIND